MIERLIGRRVSAFISDAHVDPDMLIEMFFLEDGDIPAEDPTGDIDPDADIGPRG